MSSEQIVHQKQPQEVGEPKPAKAIVPDLNAMPLEEKVVWLYQHGKGSIQDIARVHRLTVDEVLAMIGQTDLMTVTTQGDLVDASELVGTQATLNHGTQHAVQYSTD